MWLTRRLQVAPHPLGAGSGRTLPCLHHPALLPPRDSCGCRPAWSAHLAWAPPLRTGHRQHSCGCWCWAPDPQAPTCTPRRRLPPMGPRGRLGPPQPLTPMQHTGLRSSRLGPPSPSLHDPLSRPRRALSLAPLTLLAHERHQQVLLLLTGLAKGDVPGAVAAAAVARQHALHQGQKLQPPVPPEHLLRVERSLTHRGRRPLSPASRLGPSHLGKAVGAAQRGCLGSPRDHRGQRGHKNQVHLVLPWPLAPRRAHKGPAQGSSQVSQGTDAPKQGPRGHVRHVMELGQARGEGQAAAPARPSPVTAEAGPESGSRGDSCVLAGCSGSGWTHRGATALGPWPGGKGEETSFPPDIPVLLILLRFPSPCAQRIA